MSRERRLEEEFGEALSRDIVHEAESLGNIDYPLHLTWSSKGLQVNEANGMFGK